MPSRKKAKGKARKAAKEAKAKEESRAVVAVADSQRPVQEESLEVQMQRLIISAASPTMCEHGLPSLSDGEAKICLDFMDAFNAVFSSEDELGQALYKAAVATMVEYAEVYDSKLDTVISILLSYGTKCILDGDNRQAEMYCALAIYFEGIMAVEVHKTQATISWAKIFELCGADEHTLLARYRQRIPCSCLDEKYKEAKSVKKMGVCYNPNCNHPGRKVQRSKMFSCTRCCAVNYCSVECQRADWKTHKKTCNRIVKQKAEFNSRQISGAGLT